MTGAARQGRQRRAIAIGAMAVVGLLAGAGLAFVMPGPSHLRMNLELGGAGAELGGASDRAAAEIDARLAGVRLAGVSISARPSPDGASLTVDVRTRWWGPSPERVGAILRGVAEQHNAWSAAKSGEALEALGDMQKRLDELSIERRVTIASTPLPPPVPSGAFTELHAALTREAHGLEDHIRQLHARQSGLLAEWNELREPIDASTIPIEPRRLAEAEAEDAMLVRDRRQLTVAAASTHRLLTALLADCGGALAEARRQSAAFRQALGHAAATPLESAGTSESIAGLIERYSEQLEALADGLQRHRSTLLAMSAKPAAAEMVRIHRSLAELCENWADGAGGTRAKLADAVERMADDCAERTPALVLQSRYQRCLHRLGAAHRDLAAATGALLGAKNHRLAGQVKSLAGLDHRVARRQEWVRRGLQDVLAREAERRRRRRLADVEPRVVSLARGIQRSTDELFLARADLDLLSSLMRTAQSRQRQREFLIARADELDRRIDELNQRLASRLARWDPPVTVRPGGIRCLPVAGSTTTRLAFAGGVSGTAFFLMLIVFSLRNGIGTRVSPAVLAADPRIKTGRRACETP